MPVTPLLAGDSLTVPPLSLLSVVHPIGWIWSFRLVQWMGSWSLILFHMCYVSLVPSSLLWFHNYAVVLFTYNLGSNLVESLFSFCFVSIALHLLAPAQRPQHSSAYQHRALLSSSFQHPSPWTYHPLLALPHLVALFWSSFWTVVLWDLPLL